MTDRLDLLPPNAQPEERALSASAAAVGDVSVPIADLWDPWKCPVELLPWLAFQVDVVHWNSDWSEAVKRQVIANSFQTHQRLGTVPAVTGALSDIGIEAELVEWHQEEPATTPGTFKIEVSANRSASSLSQAVQQDGATMIERTKRLSQHLSSFTVKGELDPTMRMAGTASAEGKVRAVGNLGGRGLASGPALAAGGVPQGFVKSVSSVAGHTRLTLPEQGVIGVHAVQHIDLR